MLGRLSTQIKFWFMFLGAGTAVLITGRVAADSVPSPSIKNMINWIAVAGVAVLMVLGFIKYAQESRLFHKQMAESRRLRG